MTRFILSHSRHGDQFPGLKYYSAADAEHNAKRDAREFQEAGRYVVLRQWDGRTWKVIQP